MFIISPIYICYTNNIYYMYRIAFKNSWSCITVYKNSHVKEFCVSKFCVLLQKSEKTHKVVFNNALNNFAITYDRSM